MSEQRQVTTNFKVKVDCPCGDEKCHEFGTPKRNGHVRNCPCIRCRNKRNSRKGDDKARAARKALSIPGVNSRHEEVWGGKLRVESKAGAQVGPIATRYLLAEAQSEQSRSIGDNRPFAMLAMPDRMSDGLFICRLSNLHEAACALLEQWGNQ
jgi:hypothetical protein